MLNLAWALQGSYLYTVLVVSFDESVTSATRISSLYRLVRQAYAISVNWN